MCQCLNSLSLLPELVVSQPAFHIPHCLVPTAARYACCLLLNWLLCLLPSVQLAAVSIAFGLPGVSVSSHSAGVLPYDGHMSKVQGQRLICPRVNHKPSTHCFKHCLTCKALSKRPTLMYISNAVTLCCLTCTGAS